MDMKVFAFANNYVGLRCLGYVLRAQNEGLCELAGLCVHPAMERHKFRSRLIDLAGLPEARVFDANDLRSGSGVARIRALGADVGLALFFAYILKEPVLSLFREGIVNIHPSLLPYNRGTAPACWMIADGTPAGATLHYMDAGVDTGPIIEQQEVSVDVTDTGDTLNRKLQAACIALFADWWPRFCRGERGCQPQPEGAPPARRWRDLKDLDRLDLDEPTTGRAFLDRLRARTFEDYPGCYFDHRGRRVFVRVSFSEHDDEIVPWGGSPFRKEEPR